MNVNVVEQQRLLDQLKRKREEHASLAQAEQENVVRAREVHANKVLIDEKRIKAAWDEIAAAKVQIGITKAEQDQRSREQAVWQRKIELKEAEIKSHEAQLTLQSTEIQAQIKKLQNEMVERVKKLKKDLGKVSELLEQTESQIQNLQHLTNA